MLISGKAIADRLQEELKTALMAMDAPRPPGLAFLLVGAHPPSHTYVMMKKRACEFVGITSRVINLPETISPIELQEMIETLNQDPLIDGILVQLPLPFDATDILMTIDPTKDVDGFHPINMGKLLLGSSDGFVPCTPLGIQKLLEESKIDIDGKHVVIVGRSNSVGKPLAALLIQNAMGANATVTVTHSRTQNLEKITRSADVLVAAVGKPHMITSEMVREGAVVIDVGINRVEDPQYPKGYHIVGDVDYNGVADKCQAITPVPKGVGPMTVMMLLHNTLKSFQRRL